MAGRLDVVLLGGLVIAPGQSLAGYGSVRSPDDRGQPLINNGSVRGLSAERPLDLTGFVKGRGTFDHVVFNGTFAPGLSPTISNVGSVAFGPSNNLIMELGGTQRGSEYDAIVASGDLGFGGKLTIQYINGFNPQPGQSFDLFDWNTSHGTFSQIDLPSVAGGQWSLANLYTTGVISVVPVPEPAAVLAWLAGGLGGAASVRRWWRSRRVDRSVHSTW
jgi:hypothetical protein